MHSFLGLENFELVGEPNYKTLYELYGSGEFNNNENMLDSEKHMASSVEGLMRLYTRKKQLVKLQIFFTALISNLYKGCGYSKEVENFKLPFIQ